MSPRTTRGRPEAAPRISATGKQLRPKASVAFARLRVRFWHRLLLLAAGWGR
jgi:hypothetical protein